MTNRLSAMAMVWALWGALEGVSFMQQRQVAGTRAAAASPVASPAITAGGFIYVSALTGLGANGKLVEDEVRAQTRRTLERLGAVLDDAGSSLGQAVSVNVYLRFASDFDAMNGVYREFFTDAPPTRTTVVADPPDGARIAIAATAVPAGAARETMLPAGWMKSPRPYSYIVKSGDFVFFSGLISRRGTDDQFVSGSAGDQVRTILDNAGVLLKTAGLDYSDVVSARVFITDDSYFEPMNEEYRKRFPTAPPARATAVTDLMGAETKAEITMIATTARREILGPAMTPSLPISTGVRVGRHVFLSGMLGNTDANAKDLAAQTRETFTKVTRALDLAGLTPADIVENTVYMPDLYQHDALDAVYRELIPSAPPARTIVGVKLVQKTGLVEMMVTAWK
jgi:2-iminobutanoate/2-iminopropanoate deaminase